MGLITCVIFIIIVFFFLCQKFIILLQLPSSFFWVSFKKQSQRDSDHPPITEKKNIISKPADCEEDSPGDDPELQFIQEALKKQNHLAPSLLEPKKRSNKFSKFLAKGLNFVLPEVINSNPSRYMKIVHDNQPIMDQFKERQEELKIEKLVEDLLYQNDKALPIEETSREKQEVLTTDNEKASPTNKNK